MIPIWLMGFWSKYSSTKYSISFRMQASLLGFRSWSSIVLELSITTYMWRIMPSRICPWLSNTLFLLVWKRMSSTEALSDPDSSSFKTSQVRS
uniref:Uncharacterized protein n=1 Tax=Anguilla anguilla TaxID=7936 RepID=A0A0E9R825_ANGAN